MFLNIPCNPHKKTYIGVCLFKHQIQSFNESFRESFRLSLYLNIKILDVIGIVYRVSSTIIRPSPSIFIKSSFNSQVEPHVVCSKVGIIRIPSCGYF